MAYFRLKHIKIKKVISQDLARLTDDDTVHVEILQTWKDIL
jgi:hypothetical protein